MSLSNESILLAVMPSSANFTSLFLDNDNSVINFKNLKFKMCFGLCKVAVKTLCKSQLYQIIHSTSHWDYVQPFQMSTYDLFIPCGVLMNEKNF